MDKGMDLHQASKPSLYDTAMSYIVCLQRYGTNYPDALLAYQHLQGSALLRNALMGLPPPSENGSGAVTLQTVLNFHCTINFAGASPCFFPFEDPNSKKRKRDTNWSRDTRRKQRASAVKAVFSDAAVHNYCMTNFQDIASRGLFPDHTFLLAVVGEHVIETGSESLTMEVLFQRLKIIDEKIARGIKIDKRSKGAIGSMWIPSNLKEMLLPIEERWQSEFILRVCPSGQFMDEAAGICIPGHTPNPAQCLEEKERKAGATMLQFPPEETPLGGALEWSQQCFSPAFIDYFKTDALPTLQFMLDPTNPNSGRFVRCESPMASHKKNVYFQMGRPPNASLFRAVETTKFGDMVLRICNHIERCRFEFFYQSLSNLYGRRFANQKTPKLKEYDLLFIVLGARSFSYHFDSRNMLFDEAVAGWEEYLLRVVTVFFQNIDDGGKNVSLRFRPRCGRGEDLTEIKLPLGAHGLHEQGNYVQPNAEHCPQEAVGRPFHFRRCAFTARSTFPLQASGLERLQRQQAKVPIFGGKASDYNICGNKIFFPNEELGGQSSEPSAAAGQQSESQLLEKKQATTYLESVLEDPPSTTPIVKLSWMFDKRPGVFTYYRQKPQWKLLQQPQPLTDLLCRGEGQSLCMDHKIRLAVTDTPNGKAIEFSPMTENTNFASIGQWFLCNAICEQVGLPPRGDTYPPWNSRVELLNCLHVSMRYKSALENPRGTTSPALEVQGILDGKARQGFSVFLSGGSCTSPNDHSATVAQPVIDCPGTVGVAFNMPTDQDSNSTRNRSLAKAAEQGRIVTVIASHQHLPREHRFDNNGNPMCMHMGMYKLGQVSVCQPLSGEEITEAETGVERMNLPGLDPLQKDHLTFLTKVHFECSLEPVSGPMDGQSVSTWSTIKLCLKDSPRLVVPVPLSFRKQDFLKQEWIDRCSSKELLGRFVSTYKHQVGRDNFVATPKPRLFTLSEYVDVQRRLLAAHALRVSATNVDDSECISCLCDIPAQGQDHNKEDEFVSASRYWERVGCGTIPYIRSLGTNVQLHPYPCPLPSGDAKICYLQESCRGQHADFKSARLARSGRSWLTEHPEMAGQLLVKAFVTECLGNPSMNRAWWDTYRVEAVHEDVDRNMNACGLPWDSTSCQHYLGYLKRATASRKGALTDFLHGHYRLHEKLCHLETFHVALTNIAASAPTFVEQVILAAEVAPNEKSLDLRSRTVVQLAAFISQATHQPTDLFHASKILGALEELVSAQPFGPVEQVPSGTGGRAGESLVEWKGKGDHWQELLEFITKRFHEDGDDWFGYLAFDETNQCIVNTINGRELTVFDMEHGGCKIYEFREYEPGGGRILSSTSRYQLAHSFPIKGVLIPSIDATASSAIVKFKEEYLRQGICYLPFTDTRREKVEACICELEASLRLSGGQDVVYINGQVLDKPGRLQKHAYTRLTFACRGACEGQIKSRQLRCTGRQVKKMRLLEDGNFGLPLEDITYYDELQQTSGRAVIGKDRMLPSEVPVVEIARTFQDTLKRSLPSMETKEGEELVSFGDTFTMHAGSPDQGCEEESAFWFHTDKEFARGRVLFLPLEGVSFIFVTSPENDGLKLMDDSESEFEVWKAGLPFKNREKVENFVADLKDYAAKKGQPRMYVYKLYPGTGLCFDAETLIHGTIIPIQDEGVQRKLLVFHRLDVFVGEPKS